MKIAYIHQYFNTPETGGPLRSYYIAKKMVSKGHNVLLITSHNNKQVVRKNIEGVDVVYLPASYKQSFSFYKRINSFIKFYFATLSYLKKTRNIDLVYATSTPLTVGLIALHYKKKTNTPYFFEVRDLWPEVPIKLNIIKNPFFKKLLYKLELTIYTNATHIISLSPKTSSYLKNLGFDKKSTLIPNMSNCSYFNVSKQHNLNFTISYIGSFGEANHLEYLFRIIELADSKRLAINFNLVGEGTYFEKFKSKYSNHPSCTFHYSKNTSFVKSILDKSDATYTSFLNNETLEGNSPNKFFDSLASGKLTIVNTKGWLKDIVEKENCGFYHSPENPHEFIEKTAPYIQDNKALTTAQLNARRVAEEQFSMESLTNKVNNVLSTLDDNETD